MAFSQESSEAELEKVILTMYGASEHRQREQAIQWLQSFSQTPAAWNLSVSLLFKSKNSEVLFFCSNILYTKLQKEWVSQSDEAKTELHKNILGILQAYVRKPEFELPLQTTQRICLCMATIAVLSPESMPTYIEEAFNLLKLYTDTGKSQYVNHGSDLTNTTITNPELNAARKALFIGTELLKYLPEARETPETAYPSLGAIEPGSIDEQLSNTLPRILEVVNALICMGSPHWKGQFQVLNSWAKVGMTLTMLNSGSFGSILEALIEGLFADNADVSLAASNALIGVIKQKTPSTMLNGEPDLVDKEAIEAVMSKMLFKCQFKLEQCAQQGDAGDEIAHSICKAVSALAEENCQILVEGISPSAGGVIELMISCIGYPSRSVASHTIDFWLSVQDIPMSERISSMRESRFLQLFQILLRQCSLPVDATDPDDICEDISNFRKDAKELFISTFYALKSEYLKQVLGMLDEATRLQQWVTFEVALFALTCVSTEVTSMVKNASESGPHAGVIRDGVILLLSQLAINPLFGSNSLVMKSGIDLVAHYAKLLPILELYSSYAKSETHVDLLERALQCVLTGVTSTVTQKVAANGVKRICYACAKELVSRPDIVRHLIATLGGIEADMDLESRQEIIEGIMRIISRVENPVLHLNLLTSLLNPGIIRLKEKVYSRNADSLDEPSIVVINNELISIHTCVRYIEGSKQTETDQGSASKLFQEIWPIVAVISSDRVIMQRPEILATVYSFISAMMVSMPQVTLNHIGNILRASIAQFEQTLSACCCDCVSKAVEMFSGNEESSELFSGLLCGYSNRVFIAVKQGQQIEPEVVEKFFDMLTRYLLFCPGVLFMSVSFPTIVEIAAYFITIQEAAPARMVFNFLENILKKTHSVLPGQAPRLNFTAQIDAAVQTHGANLVQQILTGLDSASPSVHLSRLQNIYAELRNHYRVSVEGWTMTALKNMPNVNSKVTEFLSGQ